MDDEKDWVQLLAMRLLSEGYEIDYAFDALYAVTKAVKLKPDLLLLDIMMPAGGGINALKNIRRNVKTFALPIIIVTARSDEEIKEATEKLGISGFFVKSEDINELLKRINEVLGKKQNGKND